MTYAESLLGIRYLFCFSLQLMIQMHLPWKCLMICVEFGLRCLWKCM